MKNYLELIPLSARVHRKRNRMTLLCIFLAVFLVTVIFSMADMEVKSQRIRTYRDYGNWHISLKEISDEEARLIALRPEVAEAGWYGCLNYRLDQEYWLGGKKAGVFGLDENVLSILEKTISMEEGSLPVQRDQAAVSDNAAEALGLSIGDEVTLSTPQGQRSYTVTGIWESTGKMLEADAFGIFLSVEEFRSIYPDSGEMACDDGTYSGVWYVRLKTQCNLRRAIEEIRTQLEGTGAQVVENTALLATYAMSMDSSMLGLYASAVFLFFLVLTAGVLMIAGSMNSNVAWRTEFFGLLACLGASGKQVMRFVRLEALRWCRTAIPAGLLAGTLITWILCALLAYISPTYFGDMPRMGVSLTGLVFGAAVGLLTVLLSARSPAKRAASVSPLMAVNGNANARNMRTAKKPGRKNRTDVRKNHSGQEDGRTGESGRRTKRAGRAALTRRLPVEVALGISHASAEKRNLFLMTASFAFSILLFLAFSTLVTFMNHAVTPLKPYASELSIISPDNGCEIDDSLIGRIQTLPGVKKAYGRSFAFDLPASYDRGEVRINLISYEKYQFEWAENYLLEGSLEEFERAAGAGARPETGAPSNPVLIVYEEGNPLRLGDMIYLERNGTVVEMTVAGVLSTCPFDAKETQNVICTEETFYRLTGEERKTILDIQLKKGTEEETVKEIRALMKDSSMGEGFTFSDKRLSNGEVKGAYWSFALFVYGFLAVIALITVVNITNSISMSVSARMAEYGAMRAVGMSIRQLVRLVRTEALTYAAGGCILGGILGLAAHRWMFIRLITIRWGTQWKPPLGSLVLIVLLVLATAFLAVRAPARRLREMSIVENISAQ